MTKGKNTDDWVNEIKRLPGLEGFFKDNGADLTDPKLKDYLAELLRQRDITRAEAARMSDLGADYAYQIFSGRRNPSRDKLFRLALGIELNLDETSRLFRLAGADEPNPGSARDAVIVFCVERGMSVMQTNELLYELGMYTLA